MTWAEGDHPRDPDGKFADSAGGDGFDALLAKLQAKLDANKPKRHPDAPDWSPKEDRALKDYQMGRMPNEKLRHGGTMSTHEQEQVSAIDEAMRRDPIHKDTRLYRYVPGDVLDTFKVGDRIVDRGFMSTSYQPDTNPGFGGHRLELVLPKGTPSVNFSGNRAGALFDPADDQHEILMPRGAVLEIKEIHDYTHPNPADLLSDEHGAERPRRFVAELVGFTQDA